MLRIDSMISIFAAFCFFGCLGKDPASPTGKAPGSLSLKIQVGAASPFKTIARTGDITVSAADMDPIVASLVIKDSTVEGKVGGIPSGRGRSIVVKVYDSAGTVRYQGSATADIIADAEASVSVTLVRKTGSVVVGGTVSETDTTLSTPWGAATRLTVGAQGSLNFASVIDLDSQKTWPSAAANANQAEIDLVFTFYGGAFHLDNAVAAKAAGVANNINMTNSYDNAKIRDIGIVKITMMPVNQQAARAAFEAGIKIQGSVITGGEWFLAESTGGKLTVVRVISVVGTSNTGSGEVDVTPPAIP